MYGDGCVLVSNLQDHDPHCFTHYRQMNHIMSYLSQKVVVQDKSPDSSESDNLTDPGLLASHGMHHCQLSDAQGRC
jgi:hypothetical protein